VLIVLRFIFTYSTVTGRKCETTTTSLSLPLSFFLTRAESALFSYKRDVLLWLMNVMIRQRCSVVCLTCTHLFCQSCMSAGYWEPWPSVPMLSCALQKLHHSIHQPWKPYAKTKREVDQTTPALQRYGRLKFCKMAACCHLGFGLVQLAPFDSPTPITLPWNQTWSGSDEPLQRYPHSKFPICEVGHQLLMQYICWCHILFATFETLRARSKNDADCNNTANINVLNCSVYTL